MPKQGKKRKKKRTEKEVDISERELRQTPRCFVVKRGEVGNNIKDLVHDFREVMSPNCGKALRESRINRLEDYAAVAGHFHVSHLIVFTQTKAASYMKLVKLPQGPTLTFRLASYSLARDVRAAQKRPRGGSRDYSVAPLQVLNGFSGAASAVAKASPKELMVEMLRGMLPAVDVPTYNQAETRRTALFSYDPVEDVVHFRHYHVTQGTAGIERGVQRLLRVTRLPKLGSKADIADFVLNGGAASESEAEQAMEAPSATGGRIGVRLSETGPRLTLQLVKVEEGICNGGVLYHRFQTKTPTQQQVLEAKAKQRKSLQKRNDMLERNLVGAKANKKRMEDKKAQRIKDHQGGGYEEEEDAGAVETHVSHHVKAKAEGGGGGASDTGKRKKFHPLFGKKAAKPAKDGTVEFQSTEKGKGGKGKGVKGGGKGKGGGGKGGGKKGGGGGWGDRGRSRSPRRY
mmetsp:Transcript_73682/g.194299  ORF Transcript_73682/g.194299 Transcript_73682/m.194299 type:complete len:458 (-) Transcript_73682:106-1479(-)